MIRALKFFFIFLFLTHPLSFAEDVPLQELIGPAIESEAFKNFQDREVTEYSKILYLIDRFGAADVTVDYGGYHFHPAFAARIARWFLGRHYRDETAREWIYKWCNKTIHQQQIIWCIFPDGETRLGREVLLDALENLHQIVGHTEPSENGEAKEPAAQSS